MIFTNNNLINNKNNIDYIIFDNTTIDNINSTDPNIKIDMHNIEAPSSNNITLSFITSSKKISMNGNFIITKNIDENNKIYYNIENKIHKIFGKNN